MLSIACLMALSDASFTLLTPEGARRFLCFETLPFVGEVVLCCRYVYSIDLSVNILDPRLDW